MCTYMNLESQAFGFQKASFIFPAPIDNKGDFVFSCGRLLNVGVSGVGGSPVQLASEEAELEEEVDSIDCFRCRCVAAEKSCRGVLGLCVASGDCAFLWLRVE